MPEVQQQHGPCYQKALGMFFYLKQSFAVLIPFRFEMAELGAGHISQEDLNKPK